MIHTIQKLYKVLGPGSLRSSIFLFTMTLLLAALETLGIFSIFPFFLVLTNPQLIHENKWLQYVFNLLRLESSTQFLFLMGLFILLIYIFKSAFNVFYIWLKLNFTYKKVYTLALRLVKAYFAMPYDFYLKTNTSNHRKNIVSEVSNVVMKLLLPLLTLVSQGLVGTFIVAMIIFINPLLAVALSLVLGLPYFLFYQFIKKKLTALGQERVDSNKARYKSLNQAFGAIKDLIVFGKESYFFNAFSTAQKSLSTCLTTIGCLTRIPKFIVESLSISGILMLLLYMIYTNRDLREIVPLLALYAISARRLLPALQAVSSSISQILVSQQSLDLLYNDLKNKERCRTTSAAKNARPSKLPLKQKISLANITFQYSKKRGDIIHDLNLTIPRNTSIALIGSSGSGKTTLVDIILGLLTPQNGFVKVDDQIITEDNIRSWRHNIGYVPQQIYLTDDSITRNIAFGIPDCDIDLDAVQQATHKAFLYDFITNELPNGFDTFVGEKGVRLSGGQRQRIGLARALYHDPDVLILDEATSNLDMITEAKISEAIKKLSGRKTIIVIAHRLSTVKNSEVIYLMEKGRIIDQGNYMELKHTNKTFQAML